ncbi:hypothetical protein BV497_14785 [Fulvimonas soli]|nr:hypothetical protein BV497_14785 [Fulvimonas soli]
MPRRTFIAMLLELAALALTGLAYLPGLHGGFLFDDYANLPALGANGPVRHWDIFWRYITSGHADPTGRPLAMLSFLLDARDWPAPPFPFKRTNLLLHLLNGGLLALLLARLGRLAGYAQSTAWRADLAAVLGSTLWLLHPLFVSTTLYIVQREAMLPATFTLLGLLLWLRGRELMLHGGSLGGSVWILAGLGGCTVLATLSKANGILLPVLALTLECTSLGAASSTTAPLPELEQTSRRHYRLVAALPILPVGAAVATYLVYAGWLGMAEGITSTRPWTIGQRLLTEPRILLRYLDLLWLPRPFTPGVFNDQIKASTSLLQPLTTLPAAVAITGLIIAGWLLRRMYPALALAILFYFVGQSIESTTIPLELYFEHRNYLPTMPMFWPLALWLCGARLRQLRPNPQPRPITTFRLPHLPEIAAHYRGMSKAVLALLIVGGLFLMTHAQASLWGNSRDQALLWARLNPDSPRAQAYAAQAEMSTGRPQDAIIRLQVALARNPDEAQIALNLLAAKCQLGHIDEATFGYAKRALEESRDIGGLLASWFGRMIEQSNHPTCPEMNLDGIERLLQAAIGNASLMSIPGRRQDLYSLLGQVELARDLPVRTLALFNQALDQRINASTAFQQAALLGSHGHAAEALSHLDHYAAVRQKEVKPDSGMPRLNAWVLDRQHYWDRELMRLRTTLTQDLQRRASPHP